MGGLNPAERLRESGIDAGKATAIMVPPEQVFIAPEGHPLFDLRSKDPVDLELASKIDRGTYRPQCAVRDDGDDPALGHRRLTCVWGQNRARATDEANKRRAVRGEKPLRIEVQIVTGDDAFMLLLRLEENGRRKSETPETLCHKLNQALAAGIDLEAAANAYGCTTAFADKVRRFEQLAKPVRDLFKLGTLPLSVLGSFLDTVPEAQTDLAARIVASGATSPDEVREVVRKEREKARAGMKKRLKALPSKKLLAAADRAQRWVSDRGAGGLNPSVVPALLSFAAGNAAPLARDFPDLAEALLAKKPRGA